MQVLGASISVGNSPFRGAWCRTCTTKEEEKGERKLGAAGQSQGYEEDTMHGCMVSGAGGCVYVYYTMLVVNLWRGGGGEAMCSSLTLWLELWRLQHASQPALLHWSWNPSGLLPASCLRRHQRRSAFLFFFFSAHAHARTLCP